MSERPAQGGERFPDISREIIEQDRAQGWAEIELGEISDASELESDTQYITDRLAAVLAARGIPEDRWRQAVVGLSGSCFHGRDLEGEDLAELLPPEGTPLSRYMLDEAWSRMLEMESEDDGDGWWGLGLRAADGGTVTVGAEGQWWRARFYRNPDSGEIVDDASPQYAEACERHGALQMVDQEDGFRMTFKATFMRAD